MDKMILASSNAGKLKEFKQLFASKNVQVLPQAHFKIDDAEETGLTFIENAIIKARHAAKCSGLPAIADDSGIEVDALRGKPGIYSARFSGPNATDASNNEKLLQLLKNTPDENRTARFHCVLALMRHSEDPTPIIAHGIWEGKILHEPQGENGFGYDPLFFATKQRQVSATLPADIKNQVSHRAQAMAKLSQILGL